MSAVPAPFARALPAPRPGRAPRLTLRFALLTGVALLLAAAFGLWIARESASEQARENVWRDTRAIAARLAGDDLAGIALQGPARGGVMLDLDDLFRQQSLAHGLVRVTLFDRQGRITYSTDHALIGAQGDSARVATVLEGQESLEKRRLEDGTEVLETLVPVRWLQADPTFANGVLALAHDYAPVADEIRGDTLLQASTMTLALLLLYAASFPILRRVTATLEARNKALAEHADALRVSESQYRLIVETAAEGVWVIDVAGKTAFVNEKMAGLLGRSAVEMLNHPLADFVDPGSRPLLDYAWLRRRHVHGEERSVVFLRADGSPLYGTVSSNPIEDGDVYLGSLVMVTDVSDRKHMAHDFSNAITAITGYSDLLLDQLPPDDPRHAALEQIKRASESAVTLTRQLAD